jgi:hypothetical protein
LLRISVDGVTQRDAVGARFTLDVEILDIALDDLGLRVSEVDAEARVVGDERRLVREGVLAQPLRSVEPAREAVVVADQIAEAPDGAPAPRADGRVAIVVPDQTQRVGRSLFYRQHQHALAAARAG